MTSAPTNGDMGPDPGAAIDNSDFIVYHAQVPHDLVFSEVSDAAVRVYAAIQRLGYGKETNVSYRDIGRNLGRTSRRARAEDAEGMSDAKVKRAIMELEAAGWMLVSRRRGPLGHNLPSLYKPLRSPVTGTIPSGVIDDPWVEPKLIDDPMPKLIDDPMPRVIDDPRLDSFLDSPSESRGRPARSPQPAGPSAAPARPAKSGKVTRDSDVPASNLARWITAELQPRLDYDDRAKLPDGIWLRQFLGPCQQLLAARSEGEIREAVEFARQHKRHWRREVRTPADLYAHWVQRPASGFERDLLNWRANIEDARPTVLAPELTLAAKPVDCLDPALLAEGQHVADFLASTACPVELRRAARAADDIEPGVIARLVAGSISGTAYAGTIIHDLMIQNENLDSATIRDAVAFMRAAIRTACQSAEVAA